MLGCEMTETFGGWSEQQDDCTGSSDVRGQKLTRSGVVGDERGRTSVWLRHDVAMNVVPTTADLAVWLRDQVSQRRDEALQVDDDNTAQAHTAVLKMIDVYRMTSTQMDTYPWLSVLTMMSIPFADQPGYRTDYVEPPGTLRSRTAPGHIDIGSA